MVEVSSNQSGNYSAPLVLLKTLHSEGDSAALHGECRLVYVCTTHVFTPTSTDVTLYIECCTVLIFETTFLQC